MRSTPTAMRTLTTPSLRSVLATALVVLPALLALAACDAADPGPPDGPPTLDALPADQQALVVQAFQDVEALFDLGTTAQARRATAPDWRTWVAALDGAYAGAASGTARARMAPDTTLYTGVYDAANTKGYLLTAQYREPQGVGVWTARLQHAREVDPDNDPATTNLDAVESVTLTFLTGGDLAAFLSDVETGANAYLAGSAADPEAAFADPAIDVWRVAQVYSPAPGAAVVTYANAELRESVTVRDPVVTRAASGTGTVRDGGDDGAVRTRYYGADFAVAPDGTVTGTLLRTLTSHGDAGDGSLVSLTRYPDGSFMQTRQRGGDGVVVREVTEG